VDFIKTNPFEPSKNTTSPSISSPNSGGASSEDESEDYHMNFADSVGKEISQYHSMSRRMRESENNTQFLKDKIEKCYVESKRTPTDYDKFWSNKCNEFPLLSKVLLQFSGVPASSAPVESSFLFAKLFATDQRNRLSPEHLEDLMVIYFDKKF